MPKNLTKRAHVILPVDLVSDIDKLVGKRGRSAFLTELAQREIKLRRQREVLRETAETPYIVSRIHYSGEVVDLAETQIYHRVQRGITTISQTIRDASTGRIHGYIGLVLGALFVTLLLFGAAPR